MSTTTHILILADVSYSMLNHIHNFTIALNNFLNKLKNLVKNGVEWRLSHF